MDMSTIFLFALLGLCGVLGAVDWKKVIANDSMSGCQYGYSISISGDGLTMLVGRPLSTEDGQLQAGSAYVVTRSSRDEEWVQTMKLQASVPKTQARFGSSVSLSRNGLVALVGAPGTSSFNGSSAFVFSLNGSATSVAQLIPSDGELGSLFGASVSLSGFGNVAVAGAYAKDEEGRVDAGAAYFFGGPNWSEQKKVALMGVGASSYFGFSVALNDDGLVAAISTRSETVIGGSVFVFTRPNSTSFKWADEAELSPKNAQAASMFGETVSIDGNGVSVIVGATNTTDGGLVATGSAWIFSRPSRAWTVWTEAAQLTGELIENALFGSSVDISLDGSVAVVGARGDLTTPGSVFAFSKNSRFGTWSKFLKLAGAEPDGIVENGSLFGQTVALSSSGGDILVGAKMASPNNSLEAGAVYTASLDNFLVPLPGSPLTGPLQEGSSLFSVFSDVPSSSVVSVANQTAFPFASDVYGFGSALCTADIDLDGVDELFVGNPSYDNGNGALFVIFFFSNGTVKRSVELSRLASNNTGPLIIPLGSRFGASCANLMSVKNAGVKVAVSAFRVVQSGIYGALYFLDFHLDGTVSNSSAFHASEWNAFAAHLPSILFFGFSLCVLGDVDGNGVDDLFIGAPLCRAYNGGVSGGCGFVMRMDSFFPVVKVNSISLLAPSRARYAAGDKFGFASACPGDLNNDGIPDVAVASPYSDSPIVSNIGSVYIIFLNETGGSKTSDATVIDWWSAPSLNLWYADGFGEALGSLGDLDGDGINEIGVGARWRNLDGCKLPDCGSLTVISFNGTTGLVKSLSDFDRISIGDGLNRYAFGRNQFASMNSGKRRFLAIHAMGQQKSTNVYPQEGVQLLNILSLPTAPIWSSPSPESPAWSKIVAFDAEYLDYFGHAVSLSGDGNTMLVGAWGENNGGFVEAGAAYVVARNVAGSWQAQVKLRPGMSAADLRVQDRFGYAVALSRNSLVAIVGAHGRYAADGIGGAYIFWRPTTNSNQWSQQAKLLPVNVSSTPGTWFGGSVAISETGLVVLVGAREEDVDGLSDSGAVYVFTRPTTESTEWSEQSKFVVHQEARTYFGYSVALDNEGLVALIGAKGHNYQGIGDSGSSYVFSRPSIGSAQWSAPVQLVPSITQAYARFGYAVALDGAGLVAVIGANGAGDKKNGLINAGAAYVFTRDSNASSAWIQQAELTSNGLGMANDSFFGESVSISNDGLVVAVGAPGCSTLSGCAFLFCRVGASSGNWTLKTEMTAGDGVFMKVGAKFGSSISMSSSGSAVLIGSSADDNGQGISQCGAAYVADFTDLWNFSAVTNSTRLASMVASTANSTSAASSSLNFSTTANTDHEYSASSMVASMANSTSAASSSLNFATTANTDHEYSSTARETDEPVDDQMMTAIVAGAVGGVLLGGGGLVAFVMICKVRFGGGGNRSRIGRRPDQRKEHMEKLQITDDDIVLSPLNRSRSSLKSNKHCNTDGLASPRRRARASSRGAPLSPRRHQTGHVSSNDSQGTANATNLLHGHSGRRRPVHTAVLSSPRSSPRGGARRHRISHLDKDDQDAVHADKSSDATASLVAAESGYDIPLGLRSSFVDHSVDENIAASPLLPAVNLGFSSPEGYSEPPSKVSLCDSSNELAEISTFHPATAVLAGAATSDWTIKPSDIKNKKKLGEGGFGLVWKAEWRRIDVAVKEVKGFNEAERKQLLDEAESLAKLRPYLHVVPFYGIVLEPLAVVLGLCSMGSLDVALYGEIAIKRIVFTDSQVQDIVLGAAKGLLHLHEEGVVHRDIAARNVLLDSGGDNRIVAKVTDFGMSRASSGDDDDTTKTTVGPLKWQAPEQMVSSIVSCASDVFSFGVVLFEIFARERPWKDLKAVAAAAKVIKGDVLAVPERAPKFIEALMEQCWMYDRTKRPNMETVLKHLEKGFE